MPESLNAMKRIANSATKYSREKHKETVMSASDNIKTCTPHFAHFLGSVPEIF